MTTTEILTHLRKLDFKLSVDDGQLVVNGPKGAMTEELRAELTARKAEFLKLLENGGLDDIGVATSNIPCTTRDQDLPLSFAQQRLWFLDQLEPGSSVYNVPASLRIKGPLAVEILKRSLNEIVARHEALRTTFAMKEEEAVQVIAPSLEVSLPLIDISHLQEKEREEEALRLAAEEASRPFDLQQGPLLRTGLIRLGDDDHVLLLTLHHIVSDGWSMSVFYRELSALYRAFVKGAPSPIGGLTVQYADFAMWQRNRLQGQLLQASLSYWQKQLDGAPEVLNLPTDRPMPARKSYRGGRQSIELSEQLTQGLKALSRKEGVTLYMTLLAAFQVLLHRYSGQDDIVVGSPIANRNRIEIEGLIGFFVNTLVLRANFGGDPTFAAFLAQVRETSLGAYEHQDVPFEKLVAELRPERDLSRSPLFQAMFVFQNTPPRDLRLNGLDIRPMRVAGETTKFDVTMFVNEEARRLRIGLQYATDLFDDRRIVRMLAHFETLLESIVSNPKEHVSKLSILPELERRQLLAWAGAKEHRLIDKSLHQLFEEQVRQAPDAIAVVFEDQQVTYRTLNQRADRLARWLRGLGVGPDVLVGLYVERSVELIVGIVGILKAGGAYVPLDPSYPRERLEFMLQDSGAPVIVTQKHLSTNVSAHGAALVCLDAEFGQEPTGEVGEAIGFLGDARPQNLAYVIYTSGSTGKPKGVLVTHYNAVRLFQSTQHWFDFNSTDIWTVFHSAAFDFSVWEIWGALMYGGRLIIVPREVARSPEEFAALVTNNRVTVLNQTPSAFRQLMPHLIATGPAANAGLRYVIFGGEALDLHSLHPWFDCWDDKTPKLINMYGITETTVHVTYRLITQADLVSAPGSVIGEAIPDLAIYVLSAHGQLQPMGVPGEIYVGGAGVAKGYLGRPDLTAAKFVGDPFSTEPQAKLYRSGDLARWLPSGELEYVGRTDDQVKIRGYRIELGEIEAAINQHAGIKETAVIARQDVPDDHRLVAYFVAENNFSTRQLRNDLSSKLPDYMIPSVWIRMESLPLTAHGKIDRAALPVPDRFESELREFYAEPRSPTEELLANIWAEVLKLKKVGIHDNFFELGGHSLLATRAISRINHVFQTDIPLRWLFEAPTIARLAPAIELSRATEPDAKKIPPIVPIPRRDDVPLSFAQQRLWFLDRLAEGSAAYNVPAAFRLTGKLNVQALDQSLNEIVRRHEALRTVFATVNGEPIQRVSPSANCRLIYTDLSDHPEEEREQLLLKVLGEEAEAAFDLSCGPLIRAKVLRLAPEDHGLFLNMHHIVSDGWSLGLLFRELSVLYEAYSSGRPSPLPELPIQYGDYSVWQRNWLQGEKLEELLSYWRRQLDGLLTLQLPTDRACLAVQSYRGASRSVDLSTELSQALNALSQQEGVTLYMTLLAAFQLLLFRYCGQSDIAIGSPIAGRTRQETEGLIGFFVNTLVLRTGFSNDPTFKELLQQVHITTLEAYSHQDLPFEKLVEELHPDRNLSNSPLFQVMFILQNHADLALNFKRLTVEPIRIQSRSAKFDVTLILSEKNGKLGGSINYNTDLFDAATIERMAGHFKILLQGIVADRNRRVSDLPILSEVENHQLLVEWNDTRKDYPRNGCVHELFEQQVERIPEAVAVVFEDQQLTYKDLNARANQLAHYLTETGVQPGGLVGICLERSFEMVVALLGILKAGGAYVPLDPSYPQERLRFMLEDTRAEIVITDQVCLGSLPSTKARVICLDRDWEEIAKQPQVTPRALSTPDSLAYVMYTSGSTGVPKGVEVRHRGIVRLLFGVDYVQLDEKKTLLHLAPISFDAATFELWGALLHGGKCVLFPGKVPSARELGEVLKKNHVDTLWLTAALFNTVIDEEPEALSEIKQLLIGGEALSVPHVRKALSLLPNTQIINGYGPTESTTFSCCYRIPRQLEDNLASIPIGRPIGNTQVYILDRYLNPVPIGVTGELYIGGDGLARGYWNRPELTEEKFITNPFITEAGARLYKTGELARYLADGNIEFIGRIDDQVKIRGYRIELGEIEATLRQHASVIESVVLAREDRPGEKRLVAYVVATPGSTASASELRRYLQQNLPEYMVPAAFVFLDTLPLTPNGKIDNKSLLAHGTCEPMLNESYVPPQNFTENTIKKIWQSALRVEKIGVNDNFFDLGGHSLLAVKVLSQLSEFYKLDLKPRCLFESPTIAQLAERIRNGNFSNAHENSSWAHLVELQPTDGKRPVFFVPGGVGGEEDLLRCAPLLRRIGSGYSIYALLSSNLRGAATVVKIAEKYLKEVRTVQPEGPYFLIGECISGIVAYEIAQQLIAQGQRVASLTLLDTVRPTKRRYFSFQRSYYLKRLSAHRKHLQLLALREKMSYSLQMAKAVVFAMICRNGNRVKDNNLMGGYDYDKILMSYSPQKYDFRMNLILSNDIYDRRRDGGWADLVPAGIKIVRSNALHATYCTDHVDHTAAHLRECLAMTRQHDRELPGTC